MVKALNRKTILRFNVSTLHNSTSASNGFSFISPAAFFSSCWIFNSASASFSWQTLTSFEPSSYRASKVSNGKSSDSIVSTMSSSFFNASSNGGLLAGADATLFDEFATKTEVIIKNRPRPAWSRRRPGRVLIWQGHSRCDVTGRVQRAEPDLSRILLRRSAVARTAQRAIPPK